MLNTCETTVVPTRFPSPLRAAAKVAEMAYSLAATRDVDGCVPDTELAMLASTGLLHAPLPAAIGGVALGMTPATAPALRDVLRTIGGASLSLGRLYEGHVNAVRLVSRYGNDAHCRRLALEAEAGRPSAVWNAQTGSGLRLDGGVLVGGKVYTSGVGVVRRPIVTALHSDGLLMVMPDVGSVAGDLSNWRPLGMRASLTGAADFSGLSVAPEDIVGKPGDYYRAPLFAGGAWRVLAVQLGALERLLALYRTQIAERGRCDDPVQRSRFGEAAARLESARLWTARTVTVAETQAIDASEIDALVNLARHEFERCALDIMERIERGVGLSAMLRPNPIERIIRDLRTYLRQPFPDAALASAATWALEPRPLHADIGGA